MPIPRPTSSTVEGPPWVTSWAKDKPHLPQGHGHLMPEQTQGCITKNKDVITFVLLQLIFHLDTQHMTGFEALKHLSGCRDKTGMDGTRVSSRPTRRLSH